LKCGEFENSVVVLIGFYKFVVERKSPIYPGFDKIL